MGSEPAETERAAAPGAANRRHAGLLGSELARAGAAIERGRQLPEPVVEALARRGLFRLLLPRSLGGAELSPAAFAPVTGEIAIYDASTARCLGQACGRAMTAAYLALELAREIFGGPRGIVALGPPDPAAARAASGGYRPTAQYQGRQSLSETVGRALLGLGPESATSTF